MVARGIWVARASPRIGGNISSSGAAKTARISDMVCGGVIVRGMEIPDVVEQPAQINRKKLVH
jgi:hypothetical protein